MSDALTRYGQREQAPYDSSIVFHPPQSAEFGPGTGPPALRLKHGHVRIGSHEISTPLLLTVVLETALLALAGWLAPAVRFLDWPSLQLLSTQTHPLFAVGAFVLVTLFALVSVGFYRQGLPQQVTDLALHLLGAFALSGIVLGFSYYLYPDLILGRGILLIGYAVALPLLLLFRLLVVPLIGHAVFARRVLVLGSGHLAASINRFRDRMSPKNFTITGFVQKDNRQVEVAPEDLVLVNGNLLDYARANRIDDIVIALEDQRGTLPIIDMIQCKMAGIHVMDMNDFVEREARLLKLDTLRPGSLAFGRDFCQNFYRNIAKRLLDMAISLILLIVTSPLMLATALSILVESRGRGSILFRQTRVGAHDRTFTLYKFRSMVMDAERDGVARWATRNDPRVTRVGRFIRWSRIDELPQLINVLKGEMSFVGPRPERPEFVAKLAEQLPYYNWRHLVKPGVTGWAQIHYPYGSTVEDAFQKLQYDLYYVKHQNLVLDVMTIMQTVEVVLWGRGSR
jgi:sugar transferase (PEP-CTERM system associated)